jgi:hypothetical protein
MKKQIVIIMTVVASLTSVVSPVLAKDKGGHHSSSGHTASAHSGHTGGKGGKGGKGGGNSSDTVGRIVDLVRDVLDR